MAVIRVKSYYGMRKALGWFSLTMKSESEPKSEAQIDTSHENQTDSKGRKMSMVPLRLLALVRVVTENSSERAWELAICLIGFSAFAFDSDKLIFISVGVIVGIGRKWNRSNSSDSDLVELMTPISSFHKVDSVASRNQPLGFTVSIMSDLNQRVALNEVLMINVFTVDYFLLQVVTFTAFSVLKESFLFFFCFIRATRWIRLFCLVICVLTDV